MNSKNESGFHEAGGSLIQVYGHQKIIDPLLKAARGKTFPPFLIFSGPGGVGKKTTALYLAQALLCSKERCGLCPDCQKIEEKNHPALLMIEAQTLNIKMSALAEIRSFIKLKSFYPCRIVIIDEADKMTPALQNALLKNLEEPQDSLHFIFITDQIHQLLSTVRSRAQWALFYPLSFKEMRRALPGKSESVLRHSRGRPGRSPQADEDFYKEAAAFWQGLMEGQRPSPSLCLKMKERKKALAIARLWQEILRDALFQKAGRGDDLIHPEWGGLYEKLSRLPAFVIDDFYQKARSLEEDMASYMDCLLCLENFWQKAQPKTAPENRL